MVQPKSTRVAFEQYVEDRLSAAIAAAVANYVQTTTLTTYQGQVTNSLLGKASLVNGVIPTSQIPAISITGRVSVADTAARLALTAAQVQPGDVAVHADGTAYMLADTPASAASSWVALNSGTGTGGGAVASVNGQVGTVVLGKADVGLGNVTNTADASKPVSTAQKAYIDAADTALGQRIDPKADAQAVQTALDLKADKATTYTKAQTDTAIGTKVGVVLIPFGAALPEGIIPGTLVIERKAV